MQTVRVEERRTRSFDGTDLAYHLTGTERVGGVPLLLANGLGGSWRAWQHPIAYLQDRYRFVSWDYRGLYHSGRPAAEDALRVPDHARDALAVLDAVGAERAVILGWSMGVQVALEVFRRAPERVAGLVLVNGVAGKPWDTVLGLRGMQRVFPRALGVLQRAPGAVEAITRRLVRTPETFVWAKRLGLASRTLDDQLFGVVAGSFEELDMGVYLRILELLGEHDAHDVLGSIDVPTLVIAGDRDAFTPRRAMERIANGVRGAELLVVAGGTHYVVAEYPELVNLRLEKFLRERGFAP